jgi:hypothetical protein
MTHEFGGFSDDFFVNVCLQTTLPLPQNRETVLNFCQAIQRQFPTMTSLTQRDEQEYVLEGDRESGSYRWMELHSHRLASGYFNPPAVDDAMAMHQWLLERSRSFLDTGGLDVDCLDLSYGFNLDYVGNRDDLVAEALLGQSPLAMLIGGGLGKCIECQPALVVSLDSDCATQARLMVETRCDTFQVRTGQYSPDPIGIHMTVRRHPQPGEVINVPEALEELSGLVQDITHRLVIPHVLEPISHLITSL